MTEPSMYWSANPRQPTERERALIQELRRAVDFEGRPISIVARVIKDIADGQILDASPQEFLEAIRVAIQDEPSLEPANERLHARSDMQVYFQELEKVLSDWLETNG